VYDQLRRAAQAAMANERTGHTLSATALVHEAYLKLHAGGAVAFENEAHFYAAATQAMRRILIDYARSRNADRRGGKDARRVALKLTELPDPASDEDFSGFLILDEAISRLESADADAASVVRLRYFGGLSVGDAARILGVSEPTVKRTWAFARAWLKQAIEREP
jgi:RNA polymerase sigma factor (TIGR02999 family)